MPNRRWVRLRDRESGQVERVEIRFDEYGWSPGWIAVVPETYVEDPRAWERLDARSDRLCRLLTQRIEHGQVPLMGAIG